jgi:signal peptidase I
MIVHEIKHDGMVRSKQYAANSQLVIDPSKNRIKGNVVGWVKEQSIFDNSTPTEPPIVDVKEGMFTIEYQSNSMARRNFDYISKEHGKLVIDPDYYGGNEYRRGDVIYYEVPEFTYDKNPKLNPPEKNIARIIALPGETIEIKKGQIYIDNKKLKTFYGKALSWGMVEEEFFNTFNQPGHGECNEECHKNMRDYFNMNMSGIRIPEGHIYIMGDTWWRSIDSRIFGSLNSKKVIGKVLGYEKVD